MNRSYAVDPQKYNQFALRKTLKRTLLFVLIATLFIIVLVILSGGYTDQAIFQSPWALIILPIYALVTFFQQKNLARVLEFKIDHEKIEKCIRSNKPQTEDHLKTRILFKNIKNLVITKNTLKVKGKRYNMLTRSDLISIPKEVENYAEIVEFFRKFRAK